MNSRVYTVAFENVAISAAQDLFEFSPADDKPIELLDMKASNVGGTADAGDAQEELLRLLVRRGHTVSGSGGSAPTPRPADRSGSAAGFAAEVNNTTVANTGTTHDYDTDGWNIRIPYRMTWLPNCPVIASQADTTLVIRLVAAPADSVNCSGVAYVGEVG